MKSCAILAAFTLAAYSALCMAELGGHVLAPGSAGLAQDNPGYAEERLVLALDRLAAGQVDQAMRELAQLIEQKPNFRLAHLIYGDMLLTQAGKVDGLKVNSSDDRLRALIQEARLRWAQRKSLSAPDAVPNVLLRLALREKRAVLVDLKASRMYLMWSVGNRPRILEDHYIGIGEGGYGKRREGDRRTPVGVYRITGYLDRETLNDEFDEDAALYGAGALPVSYPNLHDRLLGRTGSGIWLHGVPEATYVRPPRSSRGCVTMANEDFTGLLKHIVPGDTLVIFSDDVEWLTPARAKVRELGILASLEQWQRDWATPDSDTFIEHYAQDFGTPDMDFAGFLEHQQRVRAGRGVSRVAVEDLSLMEYPGEQDVVLATFRQVHVHDGVRGQIRKQQYWRKGEDGRWRIIREGLDP